ncbi:MAG: hypothetical protein WC565_05645 [Parcubacteria group bacterium]
MEQLTDTKRTLEGKWQGYQGMDLAAALVAYTAKHHKQPRYWAQVPNLLLLGPIDEKQEEVTP